MYANTETDWPISLESLYSDGESLYSDGRGYMEMLCAWVYTEREAGLERPTCDQYLINAWIN